MATARITAPLYPTCAVCGDDIVIGAQRTMSGSLLCPDCYGKPGAQEPRAPQNPNEGGDVPPPAPPKETGNNPVDVAPRATEESKGSVSSQPSTPAGDRAGGEDLTNLLTQDEVPALVAQLA